MKHLILVALLALIPVLAFTQNGARQVEYGTPEDMRGVKRIFVNTGMDLKSREQIIKEIEKRKKDMLGIVFTRTEAEAELVLVFGRGRHTQNYGAYVTIAPGIVTAAPIDVNVKTGTGAVYRPMGENVYRILMSYDGKSEWNKDIAPKFARKFIEAYLRANK